MFKTITKKAEYIHSADVSNLNILYDGKKEVCLFGKKVLVEDNQWMWHLHLKLTNVCNGKCFFCVEQNAKCSENAELYFQRVDEMLSEMEKAGILFSVSLTGGEPLLFSKFKELCDVLKKHDIKFLTMNTNAAYLEKNIRLVDGLFDFVDISRHAIEDQKNQKIFRAYVPDRADLMRIKSKMKKTKMRIQCVLCEECTPEYVESFVDAFRFADDVSFRKLMTLGDSYGVQYDAKDEDYFRILEYAFQKYNLKEQTIQDYYVYEIWDFGGIDVTFSYSNMKMLLDVEGKEDDSVCREFIVHPNGVVSGSWNLERKVLKE